MGEKVMHCILLGALLGLPLAAQLPTSAGQAETAPARAKPHVAKVKPLQQPAEAKAEPAPAAQGEPAPPPEPAAKPPEPARVVPVPLSALEPPAPRPSVTVLLEPEKTLRRDPLETREEYADRIKGLGPVKVGTAAMRVENYDLDNQSLVLLLQSDVWARPYFPPTRAVLQMTRDQVRMAVGEGGNATVAIAFAVKNGILAKASGEPWVMTPAGLFRAKGELAPVSGAVKNAQGLWEADMEVGATRYRMVLIPAGTFQMGTQATERALLRLAGPGHDVTISADFWLGKFPVTQAQWQALMEENLSEFKGPDRPVEQVSWNDAQAYIKAVNQTAGSRLFRLPTEAEWEYACRAGSRGQAYGPLDTSAWFSGNSEHATHAVGRLLPNAFGLQDMLGNVWQWCEDWYDVYRSAPATDPQGPTQGERRVFRGGSWFDGPTSVASGFRNWGDPDLRANNLGFRLLKAIP